ncbi:MAG: hypothetical protein V1676_07220 [Candidatus Diapherotrites archaeon]
MTTKNSILLIIKQNNGIDYNTLLSKISGNYSSINSAMAALSRAIKDLAVMGYVVRKDNRIYATQSAEALIHSEMKNKLLLRLNQIVNSKNNVQEIDSIVEHLHMLIERSKDDAALLRAAKGSTEFSIRDLEAIDAELDSRIKHLSYISGVFKGQVAEMKNLDFNNSVQMPLSADTVARLQKEAEELALQDISAETKNPAFLALASGAGGTELGVKMKGATTLSVPLSSLKGFLSLAMKHNAEHRDLFLVLHFPPLVVRLTPVYFSTEGPHSRLKKLAGKHGEGQI